jgi:hypothetical protein
VVQLGAEFGGWAVGYLSVQKINCGYFEVLCSSSLLCVLISSTTLVRNISHYKKNWARYDHTCISVFM